MAGYIGSKAVLLSTTAAVVTGNSTVGGNLIVDTNTLFVDAANNLVGVGTSSPEGNLHVLNSSAGTITAPANFPLVLEGTTVAGISVLTSNTGEGRIWFGDPDDNDVGRIEYAHSTNAMTFRTNATDRMVIDSSGRVGIGTASPADLLHVKGTTTTVGDYQIIAEGATGGWGAGISFQAQLTGGSLAEMARITADGEAPWDTTAANQDAGLRLYTSLDGTVAERVRIAASGNVGVGLTNPGVPLHVKGPNNGNVMIVDATGTAANYIFDVRDDGNSVMRVGPTGNVSINNTSPSARLHVTGSGQGIGLYATNTGAFSNYAAQFYVDGNNTTQYAIYAYPGTSSTYASGGALFYSINSNTYAILGYWSGSAYYGLYSNGVSYASGGHTSSDARLKDFEGELEDGVLAKIDNITVQKFRWKENSQQRRSVGDGLQIGLIAQEVQAQFPEVVGSVDNKRINGSNPETLNEQLGTTLSIDYGRMAAVLVQAVKELNAEIAQLKADVAALKGA